MSHSVLNLTLVVMFKLQNYLFVRNGSEQIIILMIQIWVTIKLNHECSKLELMVNFVCSSYLRNAWVMRSLLSRFPETQHCACVSTYVRTQRWADKRPPIAWSMIGKMNSFGRLQWKYTLPPPLPTQERVVRGVAGSTRERLLDERSHTTCFTFTKTSRNTAGRRRVKKFFCFKSQISSFFLFPCVIYRII